MTVQKRAGLFLWASVGMVFVATGLSFLDRQVLSIVIIKIQRELVLSDVQYGFVNTSFLVGYAIMFTLGGRICDRFGSRTGLTISVGIWSIACCLHGLVNNLSHLLAFRFLLGIGEGGCFPGAIKMVAERFDDKKRALANGIAIGGAPIGAIIAPLLATYLSVVAGWRWSFVVPGTIGLVWVVLWLLLPKKSQVSETAAQPSQRQRPAIGFRSLITNKQVLTFILIRALLDPIVLFIMFWAPKYLNEQKNISFVMVGRIVWVPYLLLGVSNVFGGWFSDSLIKRHFSVNTARKLVMGVAALLTVTAPLIAYVPTAGFAVALMAFFMFAHGLWITNYVTAISNIFGNYAAATVMGLAGTAGCITGLLSNPLIGWIVHHGSYTPMWIISGVMYPIAYVVFLVAIPKIRPMYERGTVG